MKLKIVLATTALLAMITSAGAVELVVMSVNNATGVAGQKAFILGVQVTSTDVKGAGANPTLSISNLTFTGGANGPVNGTGISNRRDVQSLQTAVIDNAGEFPPQNVDFSANGRASIYRDSWWFNSNNGLLIGVNEANFDSGTVTTTSGGTLGPTNAVGTTGFLWTPNGSTGIVPTNAMNGQTMQYSGTYGPSGSNTLDGPTLAPLFSGGVLTVPLAQIVASGNIQVPDLYANGTGAFLSLGNKDYDFSGRPAGSDTPGYLDFANDKIFVFTPEPGALGLATLGALGLLLARRRRRI